MGKSIGRVLEDIAPAVFAIFAFLLSTWLTSDTNLLGLFKGNSTTGLDRTELVLSAFVGMVTWTMTASFVGARSGRRSEGKLDALSAEVRRDIEAAKQSSDIYGKVQAMSGKGDIPCDVGMFALKFAVDQIDMEDAQSAKAGVRMRGHTISLASYGAFWEKLVDKFDKDPSRRKAYAATTHSSSIAIWRRPEYQKLIQQQKEFADNHGVVLRVFIDRLDVGAPNDIDEYFHIMERMSASNVGCVYIANDQIQPQELWVLEQDLCLVNRGYLTAVWNNATDGTVSQFVVNDDQDVYEEYRSGAWTTLLQIIARYNYAALIYPQPGQERAGFAKHKDAMEKTRRAFMAKAKRMAQGQPDDDGA